MASAAQKGGGGSSSGVRCYYDLLEADRQATDDELKKAYRRLALRWHPDKNPDRVEEATAHFRLVQKAYETLSDPQERAWYDKHRERILKGGLGRGDAYQEERMDVFQYFTSACYDDYDDGPEGFFTVYVKVFSGLADEETRACNGDDKPPPTFPEFGNASADYDTCVGPFYAHWETFFTRKSYAWVEKHDTREAPNKFVRKAMEKENRAARDAARRERNEEIRTLVAFVKKRDPRVQAERRRLEARAREVEAKARAMAATARRAHLEAVSRYEAPEWARTGDLEAELARLETAHGAGASDDGDDNEEDDGESAESGGNAAAADDPGTDAVDPLSGLVCVACEKFFRTPGAKLSHDRSKRHRDRLERLRAEFSGHDEATADADRQNGEAEDEEAPAAAAASQKAKKKKKKRQQQQQQQDSEDDEANEDNAVASADVSASASATAAVDAAEPDADNDDVGDGSVGVGADGSKKPRRRKDRQRQKQQELLEQRREEVATEAGGASTQVCKACRQWFDSKNLLFKHLKESGHAATKPGAAAAAAASTSSAARTEGKKSGSSKRR